MTHYLNLDINELHAIVGRVVDDLHHRGDYPRRPFDIEASRLVMEAALAARGDATLNTSMLRA